MNGQWLRPLYVSISRTDPLPDPLLPKALEDWASDPWMRRDQSGPLGGSIPVRASPAFAVGEDEEGGEGGGEGH